MDVLIFGGQSNMQGQTEKLTGTEEIEGACEYRFVTDSFVPLKNPVGEDLRADGTGGTGSDESTDPESWLREFVLGASWCGNTNMVPSFCYAYIKATGRKVAAVHAAKGSTVIADWLPGTDGYKMVVKKTRAAVDKIRRDGGSIGSVYFMWLQGESDAIFSTLKEDYKSRMLERRVLCQRRARRPYYGSPERNLRRASGTLSDADGRGRVDERRSGDDEPLRGRPFQRRRPGEAWNARRDCAGPVRCKTVSNV